MSLCVNVAGSSLVVESGFNASTCPYYLLVTTDEWNLQHVIPSLSVVESFQIAVPILSLWAVAWGFRQLAEFILTRIHAQNEE